MSITAKVLADSTSPTGKRIVTFELTYPRYIHAEFMTHRVFSRNAASSRAIPFKKLLQRVQEDPAIPIHWGKNEPGMQANSEVDELERTEARRLWLNARNDAIMYAEAIAGLGIHKQVVNRLLEPWMHITVIATATDRENFYSLRYHSAAEPHFQALAKMMWEAEQRSRTAILRYGDWHLPLVEARDILNYDIETLKKLSVARCARVSYLNHDGTNPDVEKDLVLHDRLLASGHMSPFEHQATPLEQDCPNDKWEEVQSGNLHGWQQYRKTLPNENRTSFTPPE
jgi:thymidylate synthase ThyX